MKHGLRFARRRVPPSERRGLRPVALPVPAGEMPTRVVRQARVATRGTLRPQ